MRMIVEQLVERILAGETEVLGENLSQRHLVHHKFHMTRPRLEPGPPRWEASYHSFSVFPVSQVPAIPKALQLSVGSWNCLVG
jgi:hypothetical protein